MDARAAGHLAEAFAVLANINWDAYYAAHPEAFEDEIVVTAERCNITCQQERQREFRNRNSLSLFGEFAWTFWGNGIPIPGLGWLGRLCGCFEEGTEVATPDGARRIEDIAVGDSVLAWNEATGEIGPQRVTALIRPEPQATYELALRDSAGASERFVASADHPWFVAGMGWVRTSDLTPGMAIARAGGADMVVASLTGTGAIAQTYNLEVDNWHTFLVGERRVVVHNGVCRRLLGQARRAMSENRAFQDFVHRQIKPGQVTPGPGARNPNLTPEELVEAWEDFLRGGGG